jgi:hypothetical protein
MDEDIFSKVDNIKTEDEKLVDVYRKQLIDSNANCTMLAETIAKVQEEVNNKFNTREELILKCDYLINSTIKKVSLLRMEEIGKC